MVRSPFLASPWQPRKSATPSHSPPKTQYPSAKQPPNNTNSQTPPPTTSHSPTVQIVKACVIFGRFSERGVRLVGVRFFQGRVHRADTPAESGRCICLWWRSFSSPWRGGRCSVVVFQWTFCWYPTTTGMCHWHAGWTYLFFVWSLFRSASSHCVPTGYCPKWILCAVQR